MPFFSVRFVYLYIGIKCYFCVNILNLCIKKKIDVYLCKCKERSFENGANFWLKILQSIFEISFLKSYLKRHKR